MIGNALVAILSRREGISFAGLASTAALMIAAWAWESD